jgi:hypothetical protein
MTEVTEVLETGPESPIETERAVSRVGDALMTGAEAGTRAARDLWALLGRTVTGTVYGGSYYLAFGVTFGAMFVGHFIPRDTLFARGLREGKDAARSAFDVWEHPEQSVATGSQPEGADEAPTPAAA